jgi:cytochrome c-type biogenesis protein
MTIGSVGFGFAAGVLSILSPCVVPLLPIVLGGAVAAHRLGMVALVAGLVLSFTGVGLFIATIGFSIGLDGAIFRTIAAILLAGLGIVLLSDTLQQRFATATAGLGDGANALMARIALSGLGGQFVIGVMLGALWSPCVGPTLGAAWLLAAQGKDLGSVALVMMAFGLGAAAPLVIVGSLSREALVRWRGSMMGTGKTGKHLLGGGVLIVSALILTGLDHSLETALVDASPGWLTQFTSRF